jgi:general secretion pathway protein B
VIPGSVTLAPAPEPVPALETLPAGARRGIPALNLDIHSHSADPDKRFVVINGQRYREGERLGEGPVLETVTRDGAILRQGGQRFRLPVRR